jgi:LemA protein
MLGILIGVGIVLMPVVVVLFWGIGVYNTLVRASQDIKEQWSNILTEYQRRGDLLINLVKTVKSFKKHEQETLTQVIQARNGLNNGSKSQQLKNLKGFEGALSKLMLVFEQYPNLKANEQHNNLMIELRVTEDRINIARTDYNAIVGDYNTYIKTFPNNFVVNTFNYKEEVFFKSEAGKEKIPELDL